MYFYDVYDKKTKTYRTISTESFLGVGQDVLVRLYDEDSDGTLHECRVLEKLNGLEN